MEFEKAPGKPTRAGDGTRTRNLLITNQLLCQLSYAGILLLSVHPRSQLTILRKTGLAESH